MADEKLDKDPDLRQAQDLIDERKLLPTVTVPWWKQVPWWYWILAFISIVLAARLGRFLADGWDLNSWGTEQWGPLAAWFSGVLTFIAVSVSLYQTRLARADADEARRKAAEQIAREQTLHSANLAAADDRLILQLDTQSRHNQAILVAQIWKSSSKFNKICEDLLQALFDAIGINTPAHAKRQRVETLKAAMIDAERDLDNSLSDANLLVTDSETRTLLEDIQKHADQLLSKVSAIHESIVKIHGISQGEYDSASKYQKMFHKKLNKLMGTARRNITRVPSLKPEDDEIGS